MWTLSWFLDLLGPEFAERAATLGISREELIEREAESVPAGSDGLMTVLDWLAPTDKPFRKGVMLGFDARHTRGSRLPVDPRGDRADDEAQRRRDGRRARDHARGDRRLGRRRPSPLFMQIFADVFGSPPREASAQRRQPRRRDLRGGGGRASTPTSRRPPRG